MSTSARQWHLTRMVTGVIIALVVGATGCDASEPTEIGWPDGTPPPQPAAAQPSAVDSAEMVAAEEILSLVREFREAEVTSYANPQPPHIVRYELSDYLADPYLTITAGRLRDLHDGEVVFKGRPTWDPAVTEVRLDETPPTATIRDCIDASNWRPVFEATGEPVPGDGVPDQYVEWLHVKLYDEGWLVHEAGMEGEEVQC